MGENKISERRKHIEEFQKSETAARWRRALKEAREESIVSMRKRHAFLTYFVKDYETLEDFARDKAEFLEKLGVEVSIEEKYISLYFQLDFNEYETFYVQPSKEGGLEIDPVVEWQNQVCANESLNILTEEIL